MLNLNKLRQIHKILRFLNMKIYESVTSVCILLCATAKHSTEQFWLFSLFFKMNIIVQLLSLAVDREFC